MKVESHEVTKDEVKPDLEEQNYQVQRVTRIEGRNEPVLFLRKKEEPKTEETKNEKPKKKKKSCTTH